MMLTLQWGTNPRDKATSQHRELRALLFLTSVCHGFFIFVNSFLVSYYDAMVVVAVPWFESPAPTHVHIFNFFQEISLSLVTNNATLFRLFQTQGFVASVFTVHNSEWVCLPRRNKKIHNSISFSWYTTSMGHENAISKRRQYLQGLSRSSP